MTRIVPSVAAFTLLALVWVAPPPAAACGGFFCSNLSQPVSQAGEKILFSMDADGSVTAVVQISYTGSSESFAWIVPVPSVPEVSVGTNALFDALDAATAPQHVIDDASHPTLEGACASPVCHTDAGVMYSGGSGGCGYGYGSGVAPPPRPTTSTTDASVVLDAGAPDAGLVTVLDVADVGPYETTTLTGTDVAAIRDWLTAHAYLFPDSAVGALAPYVAAHDDFVVLRLRKDHDVGDLVPLVLRYASGEPCIPIQLTAIAATDDMPVTAFFLADAQVGPSNAYTTTEVPEDTMLWVGSGDWYGYALSNAVDDAGGHAFVTEFSGLVPSLPRLAPPPVSDLAGDHDPRHFLAALQARGYVGDAQLLALLEVALPPPTGVAARDFFNCLTSARCTTYDAYVATLAFDPAALEGAITDAMVTPGREAAALLARHTRLTRVATTLSPPEMTVDPTFAPLPTSRDVSNVHVAHLVGECSPAYLSGMEPLAIVMPSGTRVSYRGGTPYEGDALWCPAHGLLAGPGTATPRSTGCSVGGAPAAGPLAVLLAAGLVVRRRWRKRRPS